MLVIEDSGLADPQAGDDRSANPELFVSYASSDLDRAAALHARLAAEGFRVWFDKIRLTPGCDWHKEIEAACEAARVIVALITPRWATSEWTRYETYAHDSVIPVLAEGKFEEVMPSPLRRWNSVSLDPLATSETVWQTLLDAIRVKLAASAPEQRQRIVDLPYPANPFFTGRADDLVSIHEELHAAPVAALIGRVRARQWAASARPPSPTNTPAAIGLNDPSQRSQRRSNRSEGNDWQHVRASDLLPGDVRGSGTIPRDLLPGGQLSVVRQDR
jgi:hypothetical protein